MRVRRKALLSTCCLAAVLAAWHPAAAQDGTRLAQEAARHQSQGNLDQAMALLTEALTDSRLTNDRRATVLTDRGALLARLNQPKAAIEDFNRAVQLYPEYPAIYNNRGSTLLTLGLAREAIKDFDRAILLAPGYVAAYNNRAGARLLLDQLDGAIADFTRAIELAPETPATLTGRGKALLTANRPQAAQRDFTHALQADNRFAMAYRQRAQARIASGRPTEAIEDLSRANAFEPTNAEIYIERGNAYLRVDNVAAAMKDYAKALEIEPESVLALETRAMANVRLDAHTEAEADIARALEISPRASGAMAARALMYLRTNQPDLASREIDQALRIAPSSPETLLVKADIDAAAGKRAEALKGYRSVLAAHPASREAANGLARLTGNSDGEEDLELRGQGVDHWRVLRRGKTHVAVSSLHPRLVVPLETLGDVPPKLVEFELMRPPNKDIAVLHFIAGQALAGNRLEDVQHAAILDLTQASVLGIVPDRHGEKRAKWNWEDNRVVVDAVDGLTDEFALRGGGKGPAVAGAVGPRRFAEGPKAYAPPTWLPFGAQPQPQRRRGGRSQPKTLFQFLFGN